MLRKKHLNSGGEQWGNSLHNARTFTCSYFPWNSLLSLRCHLVGGQFFIFATLWTNRVWHLTWPPDELVKNWVARMHGCAQNGKSGKLSILGLLAGRATSFLNWKNVIFTQSSIWVIGCNRKPAETYRSDSAGREYWPFRAIFFQKVEPSCDQTW